MTSLHLAQCSRKSVLVLSRRTIRGVAAVVGTDPHLSVCPKDGPKKYKRNFRIQAKKKPCKTEQTSQFLN